MLAQFLNIPSITNTCRAIIGEHNNRNLAIVVHCSIWQTADHEGGTGASSHAFTSMGYRWSGHRACNQWFTPQPWPTAALEWPTEILTHVRTTSNHTNQKLPLTETAHIREYLSTCDVQMQLSIVNFNYVRQTEAQYKQKYWLNHFGEFRKSKHRTD